MTNYQEIYNYYNFNEEAENVIVDIELGIKKEPVLTNRLDRSQVFTAYKEIKQMIYGDHEYLYLRYIPWGVVDRVYKESFRKAYLENDRVDMNKTAEYFYFGLKEKRERA